MPARAGLVVQIDQLLFRGRLQNDLRHSRIEPLLLRVRVCADKCRHGRVSDLGGELSARQAQGFVHYDDLFQIRPPAEIDILGML